MSALPFQNRWSTLMLVGAIMLVVMALFDGNNGDGALAQFTKGAEQRAANPTAEVPSAAIAIIDDRTDVAPDYPTIVPDAVSEGFASDSELVDEARGTAAIPEP